MTKKLTRRKARESAVRLVYAYSVNKDENLDDFFELAHSDEPPAFSSILPRRHIGCKRKKGDFTIC